jgi:hypothetical protein
MHKKLVSLTFAFMTFVFAPAAFSQDTRTVPDPVFPAGCLKVPATKFIVSTTALNRDPFNKTASTPGYLGTNRWHQLRAFRLTDFVFLFGRLGLLRRLHRRVGEVS